ncbi:MAG: peptidase S8, partial [Firmicutes bacterium]|nr:peptidase S8 [Bacillota bacterium]
MGEIAPLGVQVVRVPSGTVREKVAAYRAEECVAFAEPDYEAGALFIPNDPYFPSQWGLNNTGQTGGTEDADLDAPEAWEYSSGSGVRVAVVDTGIDLSHEDLRDKIAVSANFTNSRTADDGFGHGTHVAGIIGAVTNNGRGVAGTAPGCVLMNVKVLNDRGTGYYSWISRGIVWAADNGARVINLSVGGASPSDTLREAVEYAWAKGAVLVAAAGNNGTSDPVYPAYYEPCIAVAATDASDAMAGFSSYGLWVDLAAPGVDIFSTLPDHRSRLRTQNYGFLSGTSMAAPFVSGTAALVWATKYGTDG